MKYYLLKLKIFPMELVDYIYSYVDTLYNIKNVPKIWYKRLITIDYYYYSKRHRRLCLHNEELQLRILKNCKAYHIINNIHRHNLENCISRTHI